MVLTDLLNADAMGVAIFILLRLLALPVAKEWIPRIALGIAIVGMLVVTYATGVLDRQGVVVAVFLGINAAAVAVFGHETTKPLTARRATGYEGE